MNIQPLKILQKGLNLSSFKPIKLSNTQNREASVTAAIKWMCNQKTLNDVTHQDPETLMSWIYISLWSFMMVCFNW